MVRSSSTSGLFMLVRGGEQALVGRIGAVCFYQEVYNTWLFAVAGH